MAFVGGAESFPRDAEGLARARSGPNRSICWPLCELEGKRPSADSGEEMALGVGFEFIGGNFCDATGIDVAWRNESLFDEFPQPCSRLWIKLVVVVHRQ